MKSLLYQKFPENLRKGFLAIAIILTVFVVFESLTPSRAAPTFSGGDKMIHFLAYACLAFFWFPALRRMHKFWIFAGLFSLGAVIEILQGAFAVGRTADIYDLIANSFGVISG
ncbi:MAG TPA: VanZ family protein, partial [Hellea balneolensis]|nr:VanZ family protein [Hellea balneolensis]